MQLFKIYNKNIIKQDLVNKFIYKNNKQILKIKNITLSYNCKNNLTIQKFAIILLGTEFLSNKTTKIVSANNSNTAFETLKGPATGCNVILKKNEINNFLEKLHIDVVPKLKNFTGFRFQLTNSTLSFQIPHSQLAIEEFDSQYPLFADMPTLNVHILTNSRSKEELKFLIRSIKLPILEENLKQDKWSSGLRR